jgi:hypothetical protein
MRQISPVWQRETPRAGGPCHREPRRPWRRQAPPFPEFVIHGELAFQAQIPRLSRQRVLANMKRLKAIDFAPVAERHE